MMVVTAPINVFAFPDGSLDPPKVMYLCIYKCVGLDYIYTSAYDGEALDPYAKRPANSNKAWDPIYMAIILSCAFLDIKGNVDITSAQPCVVSHHRLLYHSVIPQKRKTYGRMSMRTIQTDLVSL